MKNQIVILAAGKGTRMGLSRTPKVLAMLKQKPLILHLLHEIENIPQLAKPVIVVGYMGEKVKGVLGNQYLYAVQDKQLGTAHAVMAAKPKVKADNILVLYGDMPFIKSESLRNLIAMHLHGGSPLSMLTARVENFKGNSSSLEYFGRIIRNPVGDIVGIVEYKDATDGQRKIKEVNPGIYMFNTKWLWDNIKKITNNNSQKEYYLTDIVHLVIEHGLKVPTISIPPEQVFGVNSPEELIRAEKMM